MLHSFQKDSGILDTKDFMASEPVYHLLHRICAQDDALRLMSEDGKVIVGQNEGFPMWIYVSGAVKPDDYDHLIQDILDRIGNRNIPAVVSDPTIAEQFSKRYCIKNGGGYSLNLELKAYECRHLIAPKQAGAFLEKAQDSDLPLLKKYLSEFMYWAMGTPVDEQSMDGKARELIENKKGGLFFLSDGKNKVSMANLLFDSPRYGAINYVYTPPEFRGRGYASQIVYHLCHMILDRGLIPMLYTDKSNPTSNKIYTDLGFRYRGDLKEFALY